jgi:hypothetical protein
MSIDVKIPTIQEFIALMRERNFSRTDRFVVELTPPPSMPKGPWNVEHLKLLCEEANFPGKALTTRNLRINALSEYRAHTMDYLGDSVNLTFIVDSSWQTRMFFEEWLKHCVGESPTSDISAQSRPLREVEFYSHYIQDITITALTPTANRAPIQSPPNASFLDSFKNSSVVRGAKESVGNSQRKSVLDTALTGLSARVPGNILGQSGSRIVQDAVVSPLKEAIGLSGPDIPAIPEREVEIAEAPLFTITLHEAFPRTIGPQSMSSSSINQFHRLQIGFAYKWYSYEAHDVNSLFAEKNTTDPKVNSTQKKFVQFVKNPLSFNNR